MGAACSEETPSGTSTVASARASMYSAWLPCVVMPVPTWFGQNMGLPRRHHSQRPQESCTHGTPTRSPVLRLVTPADRKSTRLNSSHQIISYAVFCLKKKTTNKLQ